MNMRKRLNLVEFMVFLLAFVVSVLSVMGILVGLSTHNWRGLAGGVVGLVVAVFTFKALAKSATPFPYDPRKKLRWGK